MGGMDFCRKGQYINPQSKDAGAKANYSVAGVTWHETSLCEECKNKNLLDVFTDHQCRSVGPVFEAPDKCSAISQPGGAHGGPWCNGHEYGFAEYCWGWCGGGCWHDNYEKVEGCSTSHCVGFSAPLCRRKSSSLSASEPWGTEIRHVPDLQATEVGQTSELEANIGDSSDDGCSFDFEPYVQCSESGDECWLEDAEVSGDGSVWTNGTFTWMSFDLSGLQMWCATAPDDVENACSIQLHE